MQPSQWIVIVVLIGMLIAASSFWMGAWEDKYTPIEDSNLSSSYNAIGEMAQTTNTMQTKLKQGTGITTLGFLDFIVTGGYQVLVAVLSVPLILIEFIEDVGMQLSIPAVFTDGLIVLIGVALIFGIVGAIFRRKM